MTKIIGIYKITSPSGRVYIGQSWNIKKRWSEYKRSLAKKQPKLHASFTKYGSDSHVFDVIHQCDSSITQTSLDAFECFYINKYQSTSQSNLNIREGGYGGKLAKESIAKIVSTRRANGSYSMSDEEKKRRSERQKGKPLNITPEQKQKGIDKQRGRKVSPERIEQMRISSLGRKHSEETKKKIGQSKIGRKRPDVSAKRKQMKIDRLAALLLLPTKEKKRRVMSEESKVKLSLALKGKTKGRPKSEEQKRKMSIAAKAYIERKRSQICLPF